ncbi:hypothetical protein AZA_05321 [Nitrospirillum viridazoti Y2]|nr:hypothetical protein AZA_05321 [Nitrospirillum amazonense Y2]
MAVQLALALRRQRHAARQPRQQQAGHSRLDPQNTHRFILLSARWRACRARRWTARRMRDLPPTRREWKTRPSPPSLALHDGAPTGPPAGQRKRGGPSRIRPFPYHSGSGTA